MTGTRIAAHPAVTGGRRLLSRAAVARRTVSLASVAGGLLVLVGVARPWIGVPLEAQVRATALPVVAGPAPVIGALSYGAVVVALLGLAVLGLALGRGRAGALSAVAGLGIAAMAVLLVVYSVLGDAQLVGHLNHQRAGGDAMAAHFGYPVGGAVPASVLFLPVTGTWQVIAAALRPGWYATLGGGLLLAAGGGRAALAWAGARRGRSAAAGSAVAAGLLVTLGPCIAANLLVDSGITATSSGDYSTAVARLRQAERLNSRISLRPDVQLALGGALFAQGDQTSSMALLAQAQVLESDHAEAAAAGVLRQAHAVDPTNAVILDELSRVARDLIWSHSDPRTMILLLQQPYGDRPANHYAMGRYLYTRGDFENALLNMDRVLASTTEPNVDSSALTYVALSEYREGNATDARAHILEAVAIDTQYNNDLARDLATGLYTFGDV